MPTEVGAALETRLGAAQMLRVEIERVRRQAGRRARLEAAEARRDVAHEGIVEAEMAGADREGQYLGNDVEVTGEEEGELPGLAMRILKECRVVALQAGVLHRRARQRADVCDAADIVGGRAGGHGF